MSDYDALRVMPDHNVLGEDVACRGAVTPGYVQVMPSGRLHCNRCGWTTDPPRVSEVENRLRHASDEGLLKTYTILTHRLHVADREGTAAAPLLREQRGHVEAEILERMSRGAERAHTTHVPAPSRAIPEEGL